jgi:hypothetical protein
LGALGGLTLTDPSNTAAPAPVVYSRCYVASGEEIASIGKIVNRARASIGAVEANRSSHPMFKPNQQRTPPTDLSRSPTPLDLIHTSIVIEMSQKSWLVAGIIAGVERQPLKKIGPLLKLLHRW